MKDKDSGKNTQNKKIDPSRSRSMAMFSEGFKHISRIEELDIEPEIDPETGERRTHAIIGAVKIK